MKINFEYNKKEIKYISGDIYKGRNYRCNYIRYKTLYRNPAPGTENVHLYNYTPKGEVRASTMVLHGLGSSNIKFLLWLGPHLASVGVNTTIVILPGNYTRVEDGSVSGKSYLFPEINTMFQFWEHAVVDVLSTIDLLKQMGSWKKNNLLLGYCLGGMVSTMISAIDSEIAHTLFMTAGGHIPSIMYESSAVSFIPRMIRDGYTAEYNLHDKDYLYKTYDKQFATVRKMGFEELINSKDIHPLFKVDPVSYAHFLDPDKLTFVDAIFDRTLPHISRKLLYEEMKGAKKRTLPITHVSWLPFAYILAKYILHKVNINDRESQKALLKMEKAENPLEK